MAEELLTGTAGNEADQGYVPMPAPEKPDEDKTYSSDEDGLRAAARDLAKERAASEPPLVDRGYRYNGGWGFLYPNVGKF